MRKVLFMIILFSAFFMCAAEFTVALPVVDVSVDDMDGKAVFGGEGLVSTGLPGDPDLPVYSFYFMLPDDATNVSVNLSGVSETLLSGYDVELAKRLVYR